MYNVVPQFFLKRTKVEFSKSIIKSIITRQVEEWCVILTSPGRCPANNRTAFFIAHLHQQARTFFPLIRSTTNLSSSYLLYHSVKSPNTKENRKNLTFREKITSENNEQSLDTQHLLSSFSLYTISKWTPQHTRSLWQTAQPTPIWPMSTLPATRQTSSLRIFPQWSTTARCYRTSWTAERSKLNLR